MNKLISQCETTSKPYPRRCGECGAVAVTAATIAYDAQIKHDGKVHSFHIPALPVDQCNECRELFFTNVSSDAKSDGLRKHLGLLLPTEIRELLVSHNLTQRKFASHLRVAEESVSRWLNGLSIQSRALDTFMRLYFANAEVRKMLVKDKINLPDSSKPDCEGQSSTAQSRDSLTNEDHPVFNRRFSVAIIKQSQRFQLIPSNN